MPETAEALSALLTTNRNVAIEITNLSSKFCLINPRVYTQKGFNHSPPQPTIRTTMMEVCSFTKDDNTATGSVGILTYDLFDMMGRLCTECIAIMFSVPYDYNLYKNWLSIGIFENSRKCDEALYKLMYYEKDFTNFARAEATGAGLEYKGRMVDLRATMSPNGKAILKLEVYDKMD
ncbi:DELTA-actitoxin-Afr1c [Amia ocellicauda]|uniref:DELTA-actitoxin-Afr1c n=1 Tax=Amia ocellicauda TaxID=2972642 RepID=UPI0034648820|nr:ACTP4 protein [Amia calva]